ncbi:MAG: four helix bundle protein [Deltaproteobacteria bacterium]|nr:four helix bundle protein [Deltaproteobacteria bacterium]
MYGPINHFTDIEAWKLVKELCTELYKIARLLPPEEKYNLASQMMRSAVSCTANIAEGYGRFHYQENIQFCRISRGSMYEAQDHLITCFDNNYINKEAYEKTYNISTNAIRVIDGYIRFLKNKSKEQDK